MSASRRCSALLPCTPALQTACLRNPLQVFPQQPVVEDGPHILQLGSSLSASPALSPWLSPATPHHLFRKVNYDFRDERHAIAASSAVSSGQSGQRNNKGFRWEDELPGPRTTSEGERRSGDHPRVQGARTLSLG